MFKRLTLFILLCIPFAVMGQTDPTPTAPVAKPVTSYQQVLSGDTTTWAYQNTKWFELVNRAWLKNNYVSLADSNVLFPTITYFNTHPGIAATHYADSLSALSPRLLGNNFFTGNQNVNGTVQATQFESGFSTTSANTYNFLIAGSDNILKYTPNVFVSTGTLDVNLPVQFSAEVAGYSTPVNNNDFIRLIDLPSGIVGGTVVNSVTGTANEIIASSATGSVTLSTPQPIGLSSTPTFGATYLSNQTAIPATTGSTGTYLFSYNNRMSYKNLATGYTRSEYSNYPGTAVYKFPYLAASTLADSASVQSKIYINVGDYLPVGYVDSVTDVTTAINSALSAVPAAGATVYFPSHKYIISGALNVNPFTHILGNGGLAPYSGSVGTSPVGVYAGGTSVIIQTSPTANAFYIANGRGVSIEGITIKNASTTTPTAGAGVYIAANGNSFRMNNVFIGYFTNTINDEGDNDIDDNWFNSSRSSTADDIYGAFIGGLRIKNNKFHIGVGERGNGYKANAIVLVSNSTTADVQIQNNSIEDFKNNAINISNASGFTLANTLIQNNQISRDTTDNANDVVITGFAAGNINNVNFTGNTVTNVGTYASFKATNVNGIKFDAVTNTFNNQTAILDSLVTCTNYGNVTPYLSFASSEAAFPSGLPIPIIYSTLASGVSYPFLTAGNLELESRSDGTARDIDFVTGTTPTLRGAVTGTGHFLFGTSTDNGADLVQVNGNINTTSETIGTTATFSFGVSAFNTTSTTPLIYGSASSGSVYPFLTAGNLVLQSRATGANRDIVFVGNTTPVAQAEIYGATGDFQVGGTAGTDAGYGAYIGKNGINGYFYGSPNVSINTSGNLTLGGIPTAPTAAVATNTTQIATMAAIQAAIALTPQIKGTADLTSQSAAGNITTFTVGASTATFDVSGYINVTAVTTDVIEAQITYTDENSTAQTITLSSISAIGNNSFSSGKIRCKNGTVITAKTTLTTGIGSITFDAGARIVMY